MYRRLVIPVLILILALAAGAVLADGILLPVERPHSTIVVPDQLFTVKYHHVYVTIDNQLCTTKVDQIFHNDSSVDREGMYVFPMPEGSAISKFSMFAGEDEIKGKIMDKAEARGIYESIVRQRRDPALLEYIDRNTFRASVYPIPANGDKRIRLDYSEVAQRTGSTIRYVYPLSTERFSARPLEDCKVTIKIKSSRPISSVYSPTHAVEVDREGDYEATVTWSARDTKPNTDLVLYYTVSDDDIGMDLISYRSGDKAYFMLLASPRVQLDKSKVQPKNVVLVLDRTGSMAGEKIDQAKAALKFCLNSLRSEDRFNVITFNESPNVMFDGMQRATPETRKKAVDNLGEIEATGGTNINEALKRALGQFASEGSVRNYLVFLTDGLPTVGEMNMDTILRNAKASNKNNVKVFAFGVGYDVNAHLLDMLSQQNKGDADYVRPKEDIEVKVSSFFAKVADPLLTDLRLDVTGVKVYDTFPNDLPDLFKGSQLVVFGRWSGFGDAKIQLSGVANGSRRTFVLRKMMLKSALPPEMDSNNPNQFISQLWASRKIGYLLDQIRLHSNKELIDEVVRLSKEYGIPTEFTSFLADDRKATVDMERSKRVMADKVSSANSVNTGSWGISQSQNGRDMRNQAQAPQDAYSYMSPGSAAPVVIGAMASNGRVGGVYQNSQDQTVVAANVQNVAGRTFYQRGQYWEDVNLKENQKLVQIKQFSDAHFKLLRAYPRLAQYSTLGDARIVLENNQAIEIGPEGKEHLTDAEVKSLLGGS